MPLELNTSGEDILKSAGPNRRPIKIMGRRGPSNPTPDDEIDEYWIDDYWYYPAFFDVELIGVNERWGLEFIEGEMGALKRHLTHLTMFGMPYVDVDPFSVLVCIENLQRYYKLKLEECQKTNTTSSMPESTTETQ